MVRAMRKGPGLLALAALVFGAGLACRGEKTAAVAPSSAPTASVESSDVAARTKRPAGQARPVIWIGLDGLDFELVDRLAAAGEHAELETPCLRGLLREAREPAAAALADPLDDTGHGGDAGRPPRARFPGGGSGLGAQGADLRQLALGSGGVEPRLRGGPKGRRGRMVGLASGRRGERLLRQRPREPDPLRRAAAGRRDVSGVAVGRRRAGERARWPRGGRRPRCLPRDAASGDCGGPRVGRRHGEPRRGPVARPCRDACDAAHRARSLRPQPPGPDGGLLRGHRRGRARLRVLHAAAPAVFRHSRGGRRALRAGGRRVLRRRRPDPRTVDAPRRGGRRHARRHVGPRLQVGRRPALRLRVR